VEVRVYMQGHDKEIAEQTRDFTNIILNLPKGILNSYYVYSILYLCWRGILCHLLKNC
jgi:hypothetical protein